MGVRFSSSHSITSNQEDEGGGKVVAALVGWPKPAANVGDGRRQVGVAGSAGLKQGNDWERETKPLGESVSVPRAAVTGRSPVELGENRERAKGNWEGGLVELNQGRQRGAREKKERV